MTRERIRQIEAKALKKLKTPAIKEMFAAISKPQTHEARKGRGRSSPLFHSTTFTLRAVVRQ